MAVPLSLLVLFVCTALAQPDPNKVQEIRSKLGIPSDAKQVLIFGQAAHLDWDWLNYFSTNVDNTPPDVFPGGYWNGYVKPTDTILSQVHSILKSNPKAAYAIAEISFLRKYAEHYPKEFGELKALTERFRMVGGGITSPENLIVHGEAFLRNYLIGLEWMAKEGLPWTRKVWIPDDFGHDSQLPVLLEAMRAEGVAFARVPGSCECGYCPYNSTVDNWHNVAHRALVTKETGGLEFMWEASDGSSVFSYYMPTHYCPGSTLRYTSYEDYATWEDISVCHKSYPPLDPLDRIQNYMNIRKDLVSTDYFFIPAGCDFEVPLGDTLMGALDRWNRERYPDTKTYAVSSSFDYYVDLVRYSGGKLKTRTFSGTTPETSFRSNPVWMGYYASRPELKALHFSTSRLLLASEIFSVISQNIYDLAGLSRSSWDALNVDQGTIDALWDDFAPSTHHDYVTGTSSDYVTYGEQLPLSRKCSENSAALARKPIDAVISANAKSGKQAEPEIELYAWNSLGFARTGIFEVEGDTKALSELTGLKRVQKTFDGKFLAYVDAPSLGFKRHSATELKNPLPAGSLKVTPYSDGFHIENDYLRATILKSKNWGLSELFDKKLGSSTLLYGNFLSVWYDRGNIYRFGYEEMCGFTSATITITPGSASIVESGPLRVMVNATVQVADNQTSPDSITDYNLYYELYFNEPIIRMKLEGKAQSYRSVFTNFKFRTPVESYDHGTPYHWDTKAPVPYGFAEDFKVIIEPAHNFFIPHSPSPSKTPLGSFYHASIPSWGVLGDTVVGAVLRNTPEGTCASKGAYGTDDSPHVQEYALRVPTGISSPSSGHALQEALSYNTPMVVTATSKLGSRLEYSLANIVSPSSAIITVAKKGSFNSTETVLRVYQPTNGATKVHLKFSLDGYSTVSAINAVSALEDIVVPSDITWSQESGVADILFTAHRAVTTLAIKGTPAVPQPQPAPQPQPSPQPAPEPQPSPQPAPQPTPQPSPQPAPHPQPGPQPQPQPGPEPGPEPPQPTPNPDQLSTTTIVLISVVCVILVMLVIGGTLWYRRRSYQSIKSAPPLRYTEEYTESESDLPVDRSLHH